MRRTHVDLTTPLHGKGHSSSRLVCAAPVAVVTDAAVVGHGLCIGIGRPSVAGTPLLRFVRTRSEVDVDEGRRSPTRATARCACRSRGSGRQQAHGRLPQSRQSGSAARSPTTPSGRRGDRLRNWRRARRSPRGELARPFMFARVSSPAAASRPMSGRVVSPTARWLLLCWPSRGTPTTPARFCDSSGGGRAARRRSLERAEVLSRVSARALAAPSGVERRCPPDSRARSAPARGCKPCHRV